MPYEEWEVLYRQRLQIERDLLQAGSDPAEEEPGVVARMVEKVTNLVGSA